MQGWFDKTAVPVGWFDETAQNFGWVDEIYLRIDSDGSGPVPGPETLMPAGLSPRALSPRVLMPRPV